LEIWFLIIIRDAFQPRANGLEASPLNVRDAAEIERALTAFARSPNGGLIVTASPLTTRRTPQDDYGGATATAGGPQVSDLDSPFSRTSHSQPKNMDWCCAAIKT
jgi:hypothetical protein